MGLKFSVFWIERRGRRILWLCIQQRVICWAWFCRILGRKTVEEGSFVTRERERERGRNHWFKSGAYNFSIVISRTFFFIIFLCRNRDTRSFFFGILEIHEISNKWFLWKLRGSSMKIKIFQHVSVSLV